MIAFRATTNRDSLRAPIIRPKFHGAVPADTDLAYAPALSFPRHTTAQQVIDALRMMRPGNESVYYLFITGEEDRLVGVVSLRQVVTAPADTRLEAIMSREVVSLPVTMDPGQQAHILGESGFLALPVVDESGHLVGSLDATELLSAVEDAATETMFSLSGVSHDEALERPVALAARDRMVWLAVTTALALLAAVVVSRFTSLVAHAAILAAFLPLMVLQTTSSGTQTLTFIVRSLTLGEVSLGNARAALVRELLIGLCNGLCLGLLVGLVGFVWQGSAILGLIVGLATLGNLLVTALAGVVVPITLKALRLDPARATSSVVTAAASLSGLALFLGMGTLAAQLGYL